MASITLQLEKLTCPSCMQKIMNAVNDLTGVQQTKILFDASKARIHFDAAVLTEKEILQKIKEIGYEAEEI